MTLEDDCHISSIVATTRVVTVLINIHWYNFRPWFCVQMVLLLGTSVFTATFWSFWATDWSYLWFMYDVFKSSLIGMHLSSLKCLWALRTLSCEPKSSIISEKNPSGFSFSNYISMYPFTSPTVTKIHASLVMYAFSVMTIVKPVAHPCAKRNSSVYSSCLSFPFIRNIIGPVTSPAQPVWTIVILRWL